MEGTPAGGPGTVAGLMASLVSEDADVPATLVAVTVKAYEVPLVRLVTVQAVVGAVEVHLAPPGDAVAV